MTQTIRLTAYAIASMLAAVSMVASADNPNSLQRSCSLKTKGPYGFQCQGSANAGAGFEPVTFVGTVQGSDTGVFDGIGTFSSSLGSNTIRSIGQAKFQKNCFGHIQYQQSLVLPTGVEVPLPDPLDIDFTVVNGGLEVLGTAVALPGVTGTAVPRLTCRLVKIQSSDD
jgi:hypothetical protein